MNWFTTDKEAGSDKYARIEGPFPGNINEIALPHDTYARDPGPESVHRYPSSSDNRIDRGLC